MKSIPGIFAIALFVFILACKGGGNAAHETGESAPSPPESAIEVPKLTVSQFEKMRLAGVELNVIDVRTPKEIADGKIPDAAEIDYEDSDFEKNIDVLDKNRTYILYCAAGERSNEAAQLMLQKGFKNVYNLEGGYEAWEKEVSK